MNCRTLYIESFFFWKNYIDCQQSIATLLCVCVCAPERTPLAISLSVTSQTGRFLCLWDFPGKNTGVGCHFLLQGIFLTRDQNWVSHTAGRFVTMWATSCHFLLQDIFLTQRLNPSLLGLLYWQVDYLTMSHFGSPPLLNFTENWNIFNTLSIKFTCQPENMMAHPHIKDSSDKH